MTSLRVELYQIHWVLTAFGIARTVIIPTLDWLSGRMGPRLLYLISLTTFCLGSLGSALAWDWGSLLVCRVLTGIGGGLIQPLTMAIFYQIFPPSQRGMALGFSLLGWSIGPIVGSFMAGYVLEFASWRTVFAMVVPIGGIGVVLAWWLLPPLQRPTRRRLDHYGLLTMLLVAWTQLPGNLADGIAVLGGGRLSDRIAPQCLVVFGMVVDGLEGIRVIQTTTVLAGPMAARLLADWGRR